MQLLIMRNQPLIGPTASTIGPETSSVSRTTSADHTCSSAGRDLTALQSIRNLTRPKSTTTTRVVLEARTLAFPSRVPLSDQVTTTHTVPLRPMTRLVVPETLLILTVSIQITH